MIVRTRGQLTMEYFLLYFFCGFAVPERYSPCFLFPSVLENKNEKGDTMERRNATRRQVRFNAQSSVSVQCSGCERPILAGRTFAVVVKWYEEFVSNKTGEDFPVEHGDLYTSARLFTDPSPRAVIIIEPTLFDVCLKEGPVVTIHHLEGCGVVTRPWRRRAHGSAYGGKRR